MWDKSKGEFSKDFLDLTGQMVEIPLEEYEFLCKCRDALETINKVQSLKDIENGKH